MTGLPARENVVQRMVERPAVRWALDHDVQVWIATVLWVVGFAEGWWWALLLGLLLTCAVAARGATRLWKSRSERDGGAVRAEPPAPAVPDRGGKHAQLQLLEAIERHGEITPVRAALETPLTVDEADRMLSELARGGHLEVRAEGGRLLYGL